MSKLKSWLFAACAVFMLGLTPASAQSSFDLGVGSFRTAGSHTAWAILISPTKAIVPAHAVGGAVSTYSVLFGAKDRTVTNCSTCVLRTITSAVRHPNYNTSTYANDVAVITFAAVSYNTSVQPVVLAQSTDAPPPVGATAIGVANWSATLPTLHDVNHTVNSVSSGSFVTTPVTSEGPAGFLGYGGKVHGMFNYWNATSHQHTFTRLSPLYAWIIAQ